jgi:hypothetical protein
MNPFLSAVRSLYYFITGRLRFDPRRRGWSFTAEDGQTFRAFRYVSLSARNGQPEAPGAVFIPHFHVAGMSPRANVLFSLLPMWGIMGLPGFRSKYWMLDEKTGDFCGYYEWQTEADARAYATCFAMRFMTARSLPESVWCHIYPRAQAPAGPQGIRTTTDTQECRPHRKHRKRMNEPLSF